MKCGVLSRYENSEQFPGKISHWVWNRRPFCAKKQEGSPSHILYAIQV